MPLAKVDTWEWTLYRLDYSRTEDGESKLTKHIVSTPQHIEYDATEDRWPNPAYQWVMWTSVRSVSPPRHVGSLYGCPISESGWEYGRRLAEG